MREAKRKFYRTRFSIDVLSEEPLGECLSLSQLDYAINEGDCVGFNLRSKQSKLTSKQMASALLEAGSEPSFFHLNDNGEAERK
jgi:hypothetical protein